MYYQLRIKYMNINELKAKAYDCMVQVEYWTIELKKANQSIGEYFTREEASKKAEEALIENK
jgi:hypothetical protein